MIAADSGDDEAEARLRHRFRPDPMLRPTGMITQRSPYGLPPTPVDLTGPGPQP